MANIDKIKLGGTTYDIKDATALHTGELTAPLTLQDNSLTIGTAPTADAYPKELVFTDSTDRELGYLQANNQTNAWAFTVGASLPDDSSQNQITLGYNRSNNTPFTYVSQPTAFRNAISAAASSHNHAASNITSGVLATARGGVPTGGTTGQVLAKTNKTNNAVEWQTLQSVTLGNGYGTCSTTATTTAKTATLTSYALVSGGRVSIKCTTSNTVSAPTMNINSKGAKAVWIEGAASSASNPALWDAGDILELVYDGTQYQIVSKSATNAEINAIINS